MKNLATSIRILFLLLAILYNPNLGCSQDNDGALKILWQKSFGYGDDIGCCPGAAISDRARNTLLIMGTSYHAKKDLKEDLGGKYWLWEIDQDGKRIRDIVLGAVPKSLGAARILFAHNLFRGLDISTDGKICGVGNFEGPAQSFVKMNREGRKMSSKFVSQKSLAENNVKVLKMIRASNDTFLLVGEGSSDEEIVMKVDSRGNRLWKKTYESGQFSRFVDGTSIKNGGDFLLVGYVADSGSYPVVGQSDVWILRCDAKGNMVTEKLFPGRKPEVCQLDSGNFVVAYDKSTKLNTVDWRVRAFTPNLKLLWEKQIIESRGSPLVAAKMKAVSGDSFVIAGCIGVQTRVYQYDKAGNELGNISIRTWSLSLNLACIDDKAFIVSQTPIGNRMHPRLRDVKVIAIELNKSK